AEVAGEIAPHRVDVVRAILRVVVFDQEGRRLHAVIVRVAAAHAAGPGEPGVLPGLADLLPAALGHRLRNVAGVLLDERPQPLELAGGHAGGRQARWLP